MKTLKITLILAVIFASLASCTKQDLNEDDLLNTREVSAPFTGGQIDER
ncbi:hypothetical protein [Siansivirga zeaxanthinifaciens]|nr:hypothetical protein [Siansivirga zeaxanthinifaciens]